MGRSATITSGHGVTVVGLVVLIGLAAWFFGNLPYVGTFLGFSLVAPIHGILSRCASRFERSRSTIAF